LAKETKINHTVKINEVVKVKAPIVEALKNAVENPTYQFHIPGHTKVKPFIRILKNL